MGEPSVRDKPAARPRTAASKAPKAKRVAEEDTATKRSTGEPKSVGKTAEVEEEPPSVANLKGVMTKDLQVMMYGYGDDVAPLPETVNLVEDIVLDYTTKLLRSALDGVAGRAKPRAGSKAGAVTLGPEDIMFLVRRDSRKFARVRELLVMQEEIKKAKSIVDVSPEEMAKLVG